MRKIRTNIGRTHLTAFAAIAVVAILVIVLGLHLYSEPQDAFGQADTLFNSSLEKYSQAMECWDENDYVGARVKLAGAQTDVIEARGYLEKANVEPAVKQAALCLCGAWSNLIEWASCLSDAFEGYNQARLRFDYEDWGGTVTKILDAKEDIDRAQTHFLSAKEALDSIDMEALPPELKSDMVEGQAYFSEYETFLPDFGGFIDAFIPFVRGMGCMIEGANNLERYEWYAAKIAFEDSSSKISEAKTKFGSLRDCKTAEFSSSAVEFYSMAKTMEEALTHFIKGCEYAEAGNYSGATTEFEIAGQIMGKTSDGDESAEENAAEEPEEETFISRDFGWEDHLGKIWTWSFDIEQWRYEYYQDLSHTAYSTEDYLKFVTHEDGQIKAMADKLMEVYSDPEDAANCILAFVQTSFPYTPEDREYWRYPVETLVDNGDCEDKAVLFAAIMKAAEYDVALIVFDNHVMAGVVLWNEPKYGTQEYIHWFTSDGKRYYTCETTAEGWRVGDLPEEYHEESAYVLVIR